MIQAGIRELDYAGLHGSQLADLDVGGVLLVRNYWGARAFLDRYRDVLAQQGPGAADAAAIFDARTVTSLQALGQATAILKRLVHTHAFAMAMTPLIERIGCRLAETHIDCGVIRYQMLGRLREKAQGSGFFSPEDFERPSPSAIPEIFGYSKLPPHRDVRWPHIRILGCWMPLTDLEAGEALTLLPEAFSRQVATGDPATESFPAIADPVAFGLGAPYSPPMKAGDILVFHAAMVHASPIRQAETFRGSIDFRVAYPCLDDFQHYKWTFIQGRNLIHDRDSAGPVAEDLQRQAFDSFVGALTGRDSSPPSSMRERRVGWERRLPDSAEIRAAVTQGQFCPDTYLWLVGQAVSPADREFLLGRFLQAQTSYFWLLQAYLMAKAAGFETLAGGLKQAALQACRNTTLPIRNTPIAWPGNARELPPEHVLKFLEVN